MSLRFHEIAEGSHRILNPFTQQKLDLLGDICRPAEGQRHLDLACGKAEMLCQWAQRFATVGVGVDISAVFLAAADARAQELGVAGRVALHRQDAGTFASPPASFDVVSCIGATWIGGGLAGTLALMRAPLRGDGIALVGEPYWIDPPPDEAYGALGLSHDQCASLSGTLDRINAAGFELVEMVLADGDSWDRYAASQWWTVDDWLRAHPDDNEAEALRRWIDDARRSHLEYGRRYLGWGIFVIRPR